MTRTRMLREMPAEEFIDWQAFHRQHPFGYDWQDLSVARLMQVVESTKPRDKDMKKLPPVQDFLRIKPQPIQHLRKRAEAKARREGKNVRRRS